MNRKFSMSGSASAGVPGPTDNDDTHFQQTDTDDEARPSGEYHYDESTTEYNTKDLSDISGLSNLLKADDSIADRVRCLLEDDGSTQTDKPALLNVMEDEVASTEQLKDKMMSLFGSSASGPKPGSIDGTQLGGGDDVQPDSVMESHLEEGELTAELPENATLTPVQSPPTEREQTDTVSFTTEKPPPLILQTPLDTEPTRRSLTPQPAESQRESYDDIMNLSDRTEYSDLPKVVDNPIKNYSQEGKAPLANTHGSGRARNSIGNGGRKNTDFTPKVTDVENSEQISGQAKYYTDSDPNTPHLEEHEEKLLELQKYVQGRSPAAEQKSALGPSVVGRDDPSTFTSPDEPALPASFHESQKEVSQHEVSTEQGSRNRTSDLTTSLRDTRFTSPRKIAWEERCPSEQNITVRSRMSDANRSAVIDPRPDYSLHSEVKDLPTHETQSPAAKQSVFMPSDSLKGRQTASQHSLASTVDSLAIQVRSLLEERESLRSHISNRDLTESFSHDLTQTSNYSEEIQNFERTSLWKYTRQFLPGVLTPTREVRPLASFERPSPAVERKLLERSRDDSQGGSGTDAPWGARQMPTKTTAYESTLPARRKGNEASLGGTFTRPAAYQPHSKEDKREPSRSLQAKSPNYRFGPPIKYTTPDSPQRIVGRYDSHIKQDSAPSATPLDESYKPLSPEKSQTPFTTYSFVTPKRSDYTPGPLKEELPAPRKATQHLTFDKAEKIPSAVTLRDSAGRTPYRRDDSSFFPASRREKCADMEKQGRTTDTLPRSSEESRQLSMKPNLDNATQPKPLMRSAYFSNGDISREDQQKVVDPLKNIRDQRKHYESSRLERKHYIQAEKPSVSTRGVQVAASSPDTTATSSITAKNHSSAPRVSPRRSRRMSPYSAPARRSPGPRHSSPKAVRFKEPEPSLTSSSSMLSNIPGKSVPDGEYLFQTPKISCRPTRSVTPKVVKARPRSPRALPTYDQLLAEQERSGKSRDDMDSPRDGDDRDNGAQENGIRHSARQEALDWKTPIQRENFTGLVTNGQYTNEFLALKPEICFDDSCQDMAVKSLESHDVSSYAGEPRVRSVSPSIVASDTDMYRRTSSPLRMYDGSSVSKEQSLSPDEVENSWPELTPQNEPSFLDSKPESNSRSSKSSSPVTSEGSRETFPCARSKKKTPAASISTEKVQTLLLQEEGSRQQRAKQRNVAVPEGGRESSSSDDDLRNLLETFSTKAPMMEKLLRKLYEKSMQKKNRTAIKHHESSHLHHEPVPRLVDSSMQTSAAAPSKKPSLLKTTATNIPSVARPKQTKRLVSSGSQTSPTSEDSYTKPVIDEVILRESTSKNTQPRAPTRDADKEMVPNKQERSVGGKRNANKENVPKKREACAFFVDMTPEKPHSPTAEDDQAKSVPVAWYEPYEYMPPWRQRAKEESPKLGFVRVNVQDAFLSKKRDFVIRSWERQEDIAIRAEERKLKDLERKIQHQIKSLHREKAVTVVREPEIPQPSDPLGKWRRGDTTWREIRSETKKKYEALPEVVARRKEAERKKCYELNRIRASQYKERITRVAVQKQRGKKTVQVR